MKVKSKVKAGGTGFQHNQAVKGLRVKSKVKAGTPGGGSSDKQAVARRAR